MQTINLTFLFLCFSFLFPIETLATDTYITKVESLSIDKQQLFYQAQHILDDWTGENEKLVTAGYMIDSFIKTTPNFLPIYIEKARLTIMTGATGANDFTKFNKDALNILHDIQKKDPSYAKSYVLAGHAFTNIQDYASAEQSLTKADNLKTTDPWLYNNWADLRAIKGKTSEAVDYAEKALSLSNNNSKALLSAIYIIEKYGKDSGEKDSAETILKMVFKNYPTPKEQLRIAERLINGYSGKRASLMYANAILNKQDNETKKSPEVTLLRAKLYLADGFLVIHNHISQYDESNMQQAEALLANIISIPSVKNEAIKLMININLSRNDLVTAKKLLTTAELEGSLSNDLQSTKAIIEYTSGNFEKAIEILNNLVNSDPSYAVHGILLDAYEKVGDVNKRNYYYKSLVQRNPIDAWTLGNYSSFLLFTLNDINGAIKYGDQALKQMDYPIAHNNTSLAYLINASIEYQNGKESSARENYKNAVALGYSDEFIKDNCMKYCDAIYSTIKKLNIN